MKKHPAKKPLQLNLETLRMITDDQARRVVGGRWAVPTESCNTTTANGCP